MHTEKRCSQNGIALVSALILSAVSLIMISALLYMIATGTRSSGMQKRYRTALEAGLAGADIMAQLISFRGDDAAAAALVNSLKTSGIEVSLAAQAGCSGTAYRLTSSGTGSGFLGPATKMLTDSTTWKGCDSVFKIDPDAASSYDLGIQIGTNPVYTVYAKIVDTVEGNTGAGSNTGGNVLITSGSAVSSSNSGEILMMSVPYQYTIEIVAQNSSLTNPERAKLSVLYQN